MGTRSSISCVHHTFNPWWGCRKVSEACRNCYAEAWARRLGFAVWGTGERRVFGARHWEEPRRWDRAARRNGERRRVLCASMADVFESRADLDPWRARLWETIEATPDLDWLLLTKRPGRVRSMAPWKQTWPTNVWLGATVETQEWAERRVPELLRCPAALRFVTCEPLLGPVDLSPWLGELDWVIVGGESGPRARPMLPTWPRRLRDHCVAADTPFFFKQWGRWRPVDGGVPVCRRAILCPDSQGTVALAPSRRRSSEELLDGEVWELVPTPAPSGHHCHPRSPGPTRRRLERDRSRPRQKGTPER